jgi:protein SCO1/2
LVVAFAMLPAAVAQNLKPPILQDIRIDQRLNEQLPLDTVFRDETGKSVQLGQYFGRKPVILSFAYYECPMLCTLVLNGLTKGLRVIPFEIGNQFEVVNISINPREGPDLAAAKKANYVRDYGRPGAERGWHFLTGEEAEIQRVTKAAGFRYVYDPTTGQYAHAAGIMIATPKGRLSRYFYGIEYSGQDLRLGLVEASEEKIGTLVDQVLLFCFHYDPVTGRYGLAIMVVMRILGSATAIAIVAFMLLMLRRERRTAG